MKITKAQLNQIIKEELAKMAIVKENVKENPLVSDVENETYAEIMQMVDEFLSVTDFNVQPERIRAFARGLKRAYMDALKQIDRSAANRPESGF